MAITLLFAVTASADVIHETGFETSGSTLGTGFGIAPAASDTENTGGGGDHVGPAGQGISDSNPNSGSFA